MPDDETVVAGEDPQAEYDAAWQEAAALEAKEEPGLPADKEAPAKAEGEGSPDDGGEKKDESDEGKDKSKDHGSLESIEKALKDTKRQLTTVEQEKADLKAQLEAMSKKGSPEEVKRRLDELKANAPLDEYPELETFFAGLVEENVKLAEAVAEVKAKEEKASKEQLARQEAVSHFEREIKPEIVKVHPDFDDIVKSADYWNWVDKQKEVLPALYKAASESPDPRDINFAIGEYKKSNTAIAATKAKQEKERQAKINSARSLRGGGSPGPLTAPKGGIPEADDYKGSWDWAAEQLKKEGVAR